LLLTFTVRLCLHTSTIYCLLCRFKSSLQTYRFTTSDWVSSNFSYVILFKYVLTSCNKAGLIISHLILNNVSIINKNISYHPSGIGNLSRFWLSCAGPLILLLQNNFLFFSILSVPDKGYFRNASCALNLICTFLSYKWQYAIIIFVFRIHLERHL